MFKYAQESGAGGDIPAAIGPAAAPRTARASGGGNKSQKPLLVAAAGMGGVIVVVLLVLLLGSGSGDPSDPVDGTSPEPGASADTERTSRPQPTPTPALTAGAGEVDPDATTPATEAPQSEDVAILYEVQEDEKLLAIAERFGTTRRNIIRANEGMEDKRPYVETGDLIVVLISSEMTVEELEDIPGYQGPAE